MMIEEDVLFSAYLKGDLFAYSFDKDIFFQYLKNYYIVKGEVELYVKKTTDKETVSRFQSLYPEYEIGIFYQDEKQSVYLTTPEIKYWEAYFKEFHNNVLELSWRRKAFDARTIVIPEYEVFMHYLGAGKIQNVINSGGYCIEYIELDEEYRRKIEDT